MVNDKPENSAPWAVELNGRKYRWPARPVVVICLDGCSPAYLERGLKKGFLPNLARFQKRGFFGWADGVIPSFTNPNNLSIVTGSPPSVHGISGNFFFDPETELAVMMNDPRFLRSETILAEFAKAGVKVGVVTAKHKLLLLLSHNLAGGIYFSAEKADRCNQRENGIEGIVSRVGMGFPDIYSADISLFVLRAAAEILARKLPH